METLKDFALSTNFIGWLIVAVIIFLVLKLIMNTGRIFIVFLIIAALAFVLYRYFPDVFASIINLIPESWLPGEQPGT